VCTALDNVDALGIHSGHQFDLLGSLSDQNIERIKRQNRRKISVIIGAHSAVRWDEWLYRQPALRPLVWVLQRTISTPATHFAHHALVQDDGVGHYTGNYGNLLFLWDVLLGTARITQQYPPAYGLADDRAHGPEPWAVQFTYPLLRSSRAGAALGRNGHHRPPS
jgi:hypothetical protein